MSMDESPLGEEAPSDPVESGDIADAAEQSEGGEPEPPRQYVEVDDPDNRFVRVKVDGEDTEVPLSEALRGYSREADYTRKAQEAARLRDEAKYGLDLQRALEANPAMTLQILAQRYGYIDQPQAQPEPEPEYADPLERAIVEERQARLRLEERMSQREADEQLQRALDGLRGSYQVSDQDVRDVVNVAYQHGLGVNAFPMIYESMAFQRINAQVQAMRARDEAKQAEDARRTAAKASASQVISTGASANGLTSRVDPDGHMTIREAIEAALSQHEG